MNPIAEANSSFDQMKSEFQDGWETSFQSLSEYINPTRGFFNDQGNDGNMMDHQKVLDGYATIACEVMSSGLLSGMTSPLRPWLKLALDDFALNDEPEARAWLDEVERRVHAVMNKSNLYPVLFGTYKELGTFATGCFGLFDDYQDVIRAYSFTGGEYFLGLDGTGRVCSFGRETWMTVQQLVDTFGLESVSAKVAHDWEQNKRQNWYKCRHLIEPNKLKIDGFKDFSGMEYRSLYWEVGEGTTKFLAQRGFRRFPILAPRWETVTTHQVYGKGPGWYALGDIKQLQKTADDKLKVQEKLHNPPVTADADVDGFVNLIPGGVTRSSFTVPDGGVRPAYTVPDALESFIQMENHLKENIDRFYFVNLFLMLLNIDKTNMTATEIAERQQEKIMMMGPILHRLQEELLDPLIDNVFAIMFEQSESLWGTERESLALIPPPPESIAGMGIRVKYISILAQAQEAIGVQQINRVMMTVLPIAEARPDILDNYDFDEIARQTNDMEGAPAKFILSKEQVAEIREQRQQVESAGQMAAIGKEGAAAVESLAKANQAVQPQ